MAEITIELLNEEVIRTILKDIREKGGNLTIPFGMIARSWFKSNKSIFKVGGPGKYEDLSPKYKIQKAKSPPKGAGFVYPIFRGKTRKLEQSLTNPTDANSINLIVNKVALYLGTRVGYALFHQSPRMPRPIMPFRPMVLLGAEQVSPEEKRNDYNRIVDTLASYYQQILEQEARKAT